MNWKSFFPKSTLLAHYLPWWTGSPSHNQQVCNYDETRSSTTDIQTLAMRRLGIEGVIVDWYGNASGDFALLDQATQNVFNSCQKRGMVGALMIDNNALGSVGGDLNQLVALAVGNYCPRPNYLFRNGKPILLYFGVDPALVAAARTKYPNVLHLRQDNWDLDGAFGWVTIDKTNPFNWGSDYLAWFYQQAAANPTKLTIAPLWPGFDDRKAQWSANRVMDRQDGLTWLFTMRKLLNSGYTPTAVQLVTWNDHEEGSGVEFTIGKLVDV